MTSIHLRSNIFPNRDARSGRAFQTGGISILSERLKLARDAAGLSTREVAERLASQHGQKVSHATIAAYERGKSSPGVELLQRLAILYTRELEWFLDKGVPLTGIRYRKTASLVTKGEERAYEANGLKWLEAYRRLEEAVNSPLTAMRPGFRAAASQSGVALAEVVRSDARLAAGQPVHSVVEILESLYGLRVIELFTDSRIDAFAARFGDEDAVVLNPRASSDRTRMNAAHELGHVLFADCEQQGTLSHKEVEVRAYEFASHLLIQDDSLRDAFKGRSMVKLVKFKEEFGVSLAAMVYRAERCGILTKSESEWLWRQFAVRGWRRNEPGRVRADRATRFERVFEEATSPHGGVISRAEALRAMRVSEAEMSARLSLAAGTMPDGADDLDGEPDEGGDPPILKFTQ